MTLADALRGRLRVRAGSADKIGTIPGPPDLRALLDPKETMRDHRYRTATAAGPSVAEWLDYLDVELGLAARTLDQYERDVAVACLLRPALALPDWTPADVKAVLRKFPPDSRKRARAALNSWFRWAYQETEAIDANPVDRVRSPKPPGRKIVETFPDVEVDRLVMLPPPDGPLMAILFDGGLRRDEACGLRLLNVDFEHEFLRVIGGKGGKDRNVPMVPRLLSKLAELATLDGMNPPDHFWYSRKANRVMSEVRRGKPIGEASFYRWWSRSLEAADVEYRPRNLGTGDPGRGNPHAARHTFAIRYLRGHVGRYSHEFPEYPRTGRMETLQKVLGHESIQTTIDLYGHLDVSDVAADLRRMVEA